MRKTLNYLYYGSRRHFVALKHNTYRLIIAYISIHKNFVFIKKTSIKIATIINKNNPLYNKDVRKLIINSHIDYYENTVFKLIKELEKNGIERGSICVIVGGDTKKHIQHIDNVQFVFTDNNTFDLTALVAFIEHNLSFKKILLIHDTVEIYSCKFKNFFYYYPIQQARTVSIGNLNTKFSMNMGFYTIDSIMRFRDEIIKRKNTDYTFSALQAVKKLCVFEEDLLFKLNSEKHSFAYVEGLDFKEEMTNYMGKPRLREDYYKIGMAKYKANFKEMDSYDISLNN